MPSQSAFVDSGNLISFDKDISPTESDILDSNLLAQLVSTKKYSRFDGIDSWYKLYSETLDNLFWQSTAFHFESETPSGEYFTLWDIVYAEFKKTLPEKDLALLKKTIQAYQKLANASAPVVVYEGSSHNEHTVNALVSVVSTEELAISSVGVAFTTEQDVNLVFRETYLTSELNGKIAIFRYDSTFNEKPYSEIRHTVIQKLGDKIREKIIPVPLIR